MISMYKRIFSLLTFVCFIITALATSIVEAREAMPDSPVFQRIEDGEWYVFIPPTLDVSPDQAREFQQATHSKLSLVNEYVDSLEQNAATMYYLQFFKELIEQGFGVEIKRRTTASSHYRITIYYGTGLRTYTGAVFANFPSTLATYDLSAYLDPQRFFELD